MRLFPTFAVALVFGATAAQVGAADYSVKRTLTLSQPTADIWRAVGGFCDIDDWHPWVTDCEEKVIDGKLHRVLTTKVGDSYIEQRIAKEKGLSYTYRTSASPLPIDNFVATLSISPSGGATVSWSASFSSDDPAAEAEIAELIEAGLSGMKTVLSAD